MMLNLIIVGIWLKISNQEKLLQWKLYACFVLTLFFGHYCCVKGTTSNLYTWINHGNLSVVGLTLLFWCYLEDLLFADLPLSL